MKSAIKVPISGDEYATVKNILNHYDFTTEGIIRDGDAFQLSTNIGSLGLYPIKHGKDSIKRECIIYDYAIKRGFDNILRYYRDREGKLFIKSKDIYYYVRQTGELRECSISNIEEVKKGFVLLANFHKAVSGRDIPKSGMSDNDIDYLPSVYSKWCSNLQKYGRIIESRRNRCRFDNLYHDSINQFYSDGILSLNILKKSNYDKLLKEAKHEGQICHENFYYHDVLIDDKDNYYITGLDKVNVDLRIYDIGRFLRKMLCREEDSWNFDKAKMLIETYDSIIPLKQHEIGVILSVIIFPYIFYKCGKKAYEKRDTVIEDKQLKKLEKQIEQIQFKKKFIEDYTKWKGNMI